MKTKHIGFGVFLLTIGILWLLINFNVVKWFPVINSLIVLWPLILVVIGVNVIFKYKPIVKGITWLLFLAVVISYSYFVEPKYVEDDKGNGIITEQMNPYTKYGELRIGLGATEFGLDSNTSSLIDANVPKPIESKVDYKNGKETAEINLEKKNYTPFNFGGQGRSCSFHLNEKVVWDMNVNTGAVSGELDMTKLKVRNLDLNMGFGSISLDFGSLNDKTTVVLKTGFSSIDVAVPRSSGVKVKMDEGFTSSNLSSLDWTKQGNYYISPNYEKAESKIDMEIKAGFSSFNLNLKE